MAAEQTDFSQGSVWRNILRLAVPMTAAQLINVLYSVVDRVYIGHIPGAASNALTGVGVTFPILSIVIAFANLFGMGGAPIFSIERGRGETEKAAHAMGNTFSMLTASGILLTVVILIFRRPLLYLFGASDATFPYADSYLTIYLCGSVFVMLSLGMNQFINAQGFGRKGMLTVLLGAVINLLLDPLFIFVLKLGVQGAALATVLSQMVSASWAVFVLTRRAPIRLTLENLRIRWRLVGRIMGLGLSGFIMSVTNSGVQIVCNATLQAWGGDLYVGVMTILNSLREVASAPISGLTGAAQPVLGFNYGAGAYRRVRAGIRFMTILCVSYTMVIWACLLLFPQPFIQIFNSGDDALLQAAVPSLHIYFFGFFMMSLQMSGQSAAVGLGKSRQAVFFSLLRKAFIVIPLTLILPHLWGLGVNGVFLAEPISNFIGGAACYLTMLLTIWRELKQDRIPSSP